MPRVSEIESTGRRPSPLAFALALPAAWQAVTLAWIFARRVGYPADIEWGEGNVLYEAHRIFHGGAVFGPPDLGYAPNVYPGGHMATLALLGAVFPLDYALGRLLSIAGFAVACAVVGAVVHRHWRDSPFRVPATAAAIALACAAYPSVAQWYDLVRVDSLGIGVVLAAAWVATEGAPSPRRATAAALLLVYAVFVKQTNVAFAAWIVAVSFARDRRYGTRMLAIAVLGGGAIFAALEIATHGWYGFWTFTIPSRHARVAGRVTAGLVALMDVSPTLFALPIAFAFVAGRRALSRRAVVWFGMVAASLLAGLVPYAKIGGSENNFVPIVLPLCAAVLVVAYDTIGCVTERRELGLGLVCAAAGALLVVRPIDATPCIPSADRFAHARALNAEIASLGDGVLVPGSAFLPIRNGHDWPQLTTMGFVDVEWAHVPYDAERVLRENGARIVVLNTREPEVHVEREVLAKYRYVRELHTIAKSWATVETGPQYVYASSSP
jgi:hypothetical protein